MRNIKFRVFDRIENKMRFFSLKQFAHDQDGEIGPHLIDIETMPLMQYTGMMDRFGKEIYEDDIVEIRTPTSELNGSKVAVCFRNGSYVDNYYGWRLSQHREHNIEVIGNIHEYSNTKWEVV